MDSVAETEYIVAKAIRDGVIEATINHEEQYLQTKVRSLFLLLMAVKNKQTKSKHCSNWWIFIQLMSLRILFTAE